jgi:thioredoxin domain-containing protein 5
MFKATVAITLFIASCIYADESSVVDLTSENFEETTKEGAWLVEFFAPWCGHCKKLAPTWEHIAKELKGKSNIAKIDCTQQKDLCGKFGVTGYPTVKLIEGGEEKEKYQGTRTATSFVKFLKEKAGLAEDVNVADLPADEPKREAPPAAEPEGPSDVEILTAENFEEKTKTGFWFVKFYAPWCGHCKKMIPAWNSLATQLKGKANIAKVDCTVHSAVCSKFGVKGYPTLKLLKDGEESKPFVGGRDVASFAKFLKDSEVIAGDVEVKAPAAEKPVDLGNKPAAEEEGPTDVIILGDDFAEKTKEGNWFVKFYAPWCGHCKRLAPAWDKLGTAINKVTSDFKVARVDCTKNQGVCGAQGVKGYPTLKFFKDGQEAENYRGGRELPELTKFLADKGFTATEEAKHEHKEL